jgi:mRNA-degrading endonuclease toxin of MazEF toxin-antitoxin module
MREGRVSVVMVPDQVTAVDNARLRERVGMLADLLVELEGP